MDFFDKLGKKASKTYKEAAELTGKLAKEAKLKMKMSENKAKIEDIYEEIGKKVYEKHIREENIDIKEELQEECSKIDEYSEIIKETRMELLKLKDLKQCKNCYEEIEIDDNFCPRCGEKQEEIKDDAKEVEILEKLEDSEISEENKTEAEIVKENLEEEVGKEN